ALSGRSASWDLRKHARQQTIGTPGAPFTTALFDVLAVHRDVQAFAFLLFGNTQSESEIDHLENDQARDESVHKGRHDTLQLREHTARLSTIECRTGEYSRQERPNDAAD